jgi:hypothetical protein
MEDVTMSVILSQRATVNEVEAVESDCDEIPVNRRIRIMFGPATLFIQAGDVPALMEALQKAHRTALMMLTNVERESLLRSIETDN